MALREREPRQRRSSRLAVREMSARVYSRVSHPPLRSRERQESARVLIARLFFSACSSVVVAAAYFP